MNFDLGFYWKLLKRRFPVMFILVAVCTAVGFTLALRLPTIFESNARLLVQPQQISEDLVSSTVQINALEEVRLLQEQLMTRANLIEIANEYNVFENIEAMLPDDIVAGMRAATRINASGGESRRAGPQPVLTTVTFRARNGQIAASVVNEYVTRITAENVRIRTGAAGETLDFFEQEVERLGTELDLRSARITEFQRDNADALPGDQDFRLQRQTLLQERLAAAERDRRNLIETRERTLEMFEATGTIGPAEGENQTPEQRELAELERELSRSLAVFSETAPQVQALQRRIAQLQDIIAATPVEGANAEDEALTGPQALLNLQLAEFDSRITAYDIEIGEIEAELLGLEDAISRTPLNAITLQGLNRDYENIRLQYDSAVQRLAAASMGERIEVTARGQRITLIEPASVPDSPASPNRPLIAIGGFGLDIGLAMALFLALELLNRTVRRPSEIVSALGITPLATIPFIESSTQRFFRRLRRLAVALLVLVGVPAGLWAIDTYYLPLDLLAERIFDRLGLA